MAQNQTARQEEPDLAAVGQFGPQPALDALVDRQPQRRFVGFASLSTRVSLIILYSPLFGVFMMGYAMPVTGASL
ncbi:hypothetical protein [Marinobacterium aestuariivivens]|uniref:hypothetical protein n=1 Tax=Marinobacterium aestuariivivens TaxID=1698799 RepID=UPI0036D403B8